MTLPASTPAALTRALHSPPLRTLVAKELHEWLRGARRRGRAWAAAMEVRKTGMGVERVGLLLRQLLSPRLVFLRSLSSLYPPFCLPTLLSKLRPGSGTRRSLAAPGTRRARRISRCASAGSPRGVRSLGRPRLPRALRRCASSAGGRSGRFRCLCFA